jgi:hypothetical protein
LPATADDELRQLPKPHRASLFFSQIPKSASPACRIALAAIRFSSDGL